MQRAKGEWGWCLPRGRHGASEGHPEHRFNTGRLTLLVVSVPCDTSKPGSQQRPASPYPQQKTDSRHTVSKMTAK